MKQSLLLSLVAGCLLFLLESTECKSVEKSKNKIAKQMTKPGNIAGAVIGGYVAHKVAKKIIKKPKLKFKTGVGFYGSQLYMMSVVSRESWSPRPPMVEYYYIGPATHIFVHHTATNDCYEMMTCIQQLQMLQHQKMDVQGLPDMGYNFMIGGDGRIYEGLGWHTYGHNRPNTGDESISVAFIGDFSLYRPNDAQLEAFGRLIRFGDEQDFLKSYRIHGHRDISCSKCPGDALYALIRAMPRYRTLPPLLNCFNFNQTWPFQGY